MKFIDLEARQKWEDQRARVKQKSRSYQGTFVYPTESIEPEVAATLVRIDKWKTKGVRPTKRARSFFRKANRHQRNLELARQSNRKHAALRKRHETKRDRAFENADLRREQGHRGLKPHILRRQALREL